MSTKVLVAVLWLFGCGVRGQSSRSSFQEGEVARGKLAFVSGFTFEANSGAFDVKPGLGPRFNLDSCAGCHSHPGVGGSGGIRNPQMAYASQLPMAVRRQLIPESGPPRQYRSRRTGGLVPLFRDAGQGHACPPAHPCLHEGAACSELVYRIPTPLFGLGLVEDLSDDDILSPRAGESDIKAQFGIRGIVSRDAWGRVGRFGQKAKYATLAEFIGDALGDEMGVSTDELRAGAGAGVEDLAAFVRSLPPPAPQVPTLGKVESVFRGGETFDRIGCGLCHTAFIQNRRTKGKVVLYSDLLVHSMGSDLADGVAEGAASGKDFRTALLWGLRYRAYLMHDGRATDLPSAIAAHDDAAGQSEAHFSVSQFLRLSAEDRENLLTFLGHL